MCAAPAQILCKIACTIAAFQEIPEPSTMVESQPQLKDFALTSIPFEITRFTAAQAVINRQRM